VIDIAAVADGHFKFEFVVIVIREPLSDVVGNAGCAQDGSGKSPIDGVLGGNGGDAFGAHLENLVVAVHPFDVVHIFRDAVEQLPGARYKVLRNVVCDSANADITHRQTPAAAGFNQIVDFFAGPESVPEIADRAKVHQICADADQVIGD